MTIDYAESTTASVSSFVPTETAATGLASRWVRRSEPHYVVRRKALFGHLVVYGHSETALHARIPSAWARLLEGVSDASTGIVELELFGPATQQQVEEQSLGGGQVSRKEAARALLKKWLAEPIDEKEDAALVTFMRAMNEDRLSDRPLYP